MTQIDITHSKIDTYGGDAVVKDVERSGAVTFVAADYLQLEGAIETGKRERTYFRLTQRDGPDRLNFRWKNVQTVDLVRCNDDSANLGPLLDDRVLPLPTAFGSSRETIA